MNNSALDNMAVALPPGLEPWFSEALARLTRGTEADIGHLFNTHESPVELPGTKTTVRTHFLAFDGNDLPAVELISQAMAASITDFCIPRGKLQEALLAWQTTNSTAAITKLQAHARDLFVASEKSGEGGELLLFLLLEKILGIPQLISKMALKTSTSMHVHGSDGIHAAFADDGKLDLYWGESKLHESPSSAFSDCFNSLAPYLRADGTNARKQDLMLIRQNLDLGQKELALHLIKYFDEGHPEAMDVRFRGACLIGFDYSDYMDLKALEDTQRQRLVTAVRRWHTSISGHVGQNALSQVTIDVFCIPFPSVSKLRAAINSAVGVSK